MKKLIDGFPIYVPHNRLILISDTNKKVFDINIFSKLILDVPDRPINSSGFSINYDKGDKYIFIIGGFIKSKALKTCFKLNIFTYEYTKIADLNEGRFRPGTFITKGR